ncbi:MAG TPA: VOC family protein [Acidimicrobiales bacterium]|nr:VOC family protein [Acidimicrobiales bacterium]
MRHDLELGYLGVEVPDPATLTPFFAEVVGLVPGEPAADAGTLTWRNDDRAYRLIVEPGAANDATFVGLEAAHAGSFDRVVERLRRAGHEVSSGSAEEAAARRVRRLASAAAPWGVRVEIVEAIESAPVPFASPLMPGGFLTEGVGFGHTVFATTAFDESHAFLVDGLGFSQSDWLEMQVAEGIVLEVRFYHCNARHHTMALARAPFDLPQKLHHVMVEANDFNDVGAAFDRAWATDLALPMGLGLHDNDRMFSFYVASPAGFLVEVGSGARTITEPWTDNRVYDATSVWGHKPMRAGA